MTIELKSDELVALVKRVFKPGAGDHAMAILVDLPDDDAQDNDDWKARRDMAFNWYQGLQPRIVETGLTQIDLVLYRNTGADNADLPATCFYHEGGPFPSRSSALTGNSLVFTEVFKTHQILMAPTEYSTTAPLKNAAKSYPFRAGTMPGFSAAMIPALRLDYSIIGARVDYLKTVLDDAIGCDMVFSANGREHAFYIDLRHRKAHASGGVFYENGIAGNLPSGESYIVPYEGELANDPSKTAGELPVQFGEDVVVYRVENNSAVEVLSQNDASMREEKRILGEPAYGNIAELGLGVLGDFGLEPTGEVLLDEKLGLHIAFGRSDHFGGRVGPKDFSSPDNVVHIDRVYIEKLQPKIAIKKAVLLMPENQQILLMQDNAWVISFA